MKGVIGTYRIGEILLPKYVFGNVYTIIKRNFVEQTEKVEGLDNSGCKIRKGYLFTKN